MAEVWGELVRTKDLQGIRRSLGGEAPGGSNKFLIFSRQKHWPMNSLTKHSTRQRIG